MFLRVAPDGAGGERDLYEVLRACLPQVGAVDPRLQGFKLNLRRTKPFVMGFVEAPQPFHRNGVPEILRQAGLRPPSFEQAVEFSIQYAESRALMFGQEKSGPTMLFFHPLVGAFGRTTFPRPANRLAPAADSQAVYITSLQLRFLDDPVPGRIMPDVGLFDVVSGAGMIRPQFGARSYQLAGVRV